MAEHESQPSDVGVVLVGGSNTVMRYGWSRAMMASPTRVSAKAALGASSNIFAIRTLMDHPNPDAEVLIFNANVTEYPLMKLGDYDFELARDAYKHILSYCQDRQLFPINLIWPEQNYLDAKASGDLTLAADTYFSSLSLELSVPFIDGFRILEWLQGAFNRERSSLFLDRDHLNNFTAQTIGRAISKTVMELKNEEKLRNAGIAHQLTREFEALELPTQVSTSTGGLETRTVSNSLITQDFVVLTADSSLTVEVDDEWEVVGYLLNARHCNASIRVWGESGVARRASFRRYNPDEAASPFVCARALPFPVRPKNGKVVLSIVAPTEDDYLDRLFAGENKFERHELEIEIGQLFLRGRQSNKLRIAVPGMDLDLTNRVIKNLNISR
ncbi:hypothetical protein [Corynebacterium casei]|uniref:hypothetical protein n=1 Tax=Corynebacterium casei TaxID=160386 RepID=UPI003FD64CED